MALDHALEAVALAGADDVDALALVEDRDQHLVAGLRRFGALRDAHLALHARRRHIGLLVVAGRRLGGAARRILLDEAQLHGFVTVDLRRLRLHHDARSRLQHGGGLERAVLEEQLRHPDFLTDDSSDHGYLPCSLPKALISTSTPAGRSSFIKASTVCGVGSKMSIRRLWVRTSNCSRDFLSTCGERSTVHLLISVGSGIGPASRAPVRLAVSTISPVLWSSTRAS